MQVIINGERRDMPEPLTVAELLRHLGVKPEHVAVEINKDLVTRSRQGDTAIASGDVLEIVTLVGGGSWRPRRSRPSRSARTSSGAACSSGRASIRPSS